MRLDRRMLYVLAAIGASIAGAWVVAEDRDPVSTFSPDRASFVVRYHGEASSLSVNGIFVLPGERLTFEVVDATRSDDSFTVVEISGQVVRLRAHNLAEHLATIEVPRAR